MRGVLVSILFVGIVAIALAAYWALRDTPNIDVLLADTAGAATRTTQILDRYQQPIYSYGKFQHKHVNLSDVAEPFTQALVATEDRRFYAHFGMDPLGIIRAMVVNVRSKSVSEGASTLTQQLVRNLYLSNERSYKRKIQEIWLAIQMEQRLSKQQILEQYINNVYFGEGAYGIAAASQVYFNKPASQLKLEEAALLAGLPQAPSLYNPFFNKDKALARRNEVLQNMVEAGYIDSDTAKKAQETSVKLNSHGRQVSDALSAPYFTQWVVRKIQDYFGLDEQSFWQSGLKVYTTLDPKAQRLAARSVMENSLLNNNSSAQVGLMMLDIPSGEILAYIGGKNFAKSQYDRVTLAKRPPGSLFKVFTYTAAMEQGYELDGVYVDAPINLKDWAPKNYSGEHYGPMTLAKAFITSNNIVAVKILDEIGPGRVVSLARRLGIQSTLEENLSLTLGSSSTSLWEMCGAVGAIASNGQRVEPHGILRVTDRQGRELFKHYGMPQTVLDEPTAEKMQALMHGVVTMGTGRAANIGRAAGGKTGTSDDNRDGWFMGYTSNVLMGVWIGRDDNQPVSGLVGGGAPAQIWGQTLSGYHHGGLSAAFQWKSVSPLTDELVNTVDFSKLSDGERNNRLSEDPNALDALLEDPELNTDESVDSEEGSVPPVPGVAESAIPGAPIGPVQPQPAPQQQQVYAPISTQAVAPPKPVQREFSLPPAPQPPRKPAGSATSTAAPGSVEPQANMAVVVQKGPPIPRDSLVAPVPSSR